MKIKKGDIIKFGRYNWRILEVCAEKALLLSERTVKKRKYNSMVIFEKGYEEPTTWEECDLRYYLNNEFINTFNDDEKKQIITTNLSNTYNPWYDTDGGSDTSDKLFLLSVDEVLEYLGDYYGKNKVRAKVKPLGKQIDDKFNELRIAVDSNGAETSWWLRTPGYTMECAVTVFPHGVIDGSGTLAGCPNGVRPAMWVKSNLFV